MDELVYRIALSMMPLKPQDQRKLIEVAGSAKELYDNVKDIRNIAPDATEHAIKILSDMPLYVERAKYEIDFSEHKHINILSFDDSCYPERLRHIPDAPIILYYLGTTNLNSKHAISVVGTRHCTSYGIDLCNQFIDDLKKLVPDLVVFSGMAYGIDITAHQRCIADEIQTVGVFAHGLDIVYPHVHRNEANVMSKSGGLLTEYPSRTEINKSYFISRNRIIAGCSDATIVVESNDKGGSLHTARMAFGYDRNVYTFPGRITDKASRGCLDLVYNDVAKLICSAEQFVLAQGWTENVNQAEECQRSLFPELDETTLLIINKMSECDDMSLEQMQTSTSLPINVLRNKIIEMEMENIISLSPGGNYRLNNTYR